MNLGGDPSQALIHVTATTGNFVISLSSTDLGRGPGNRHRPIEGDAGRVLRHGVALDTADTDTGPHCMGTFISRATTALGNAPVITAAEEPQPVMMAADDG